MWFARDLAIFDTNYLAPELKLFTERNKTINYLLSMLTEVAEVSTIQFWCDEMIDASCWLTVFDPKNMVYHLSNRYTLSIGAPAQAWKVTWDGKTPTPRWSSNIGSKQRPPCRTWKEPSFDVGTFLSSLNSFINWNQGGRHFHPQGGAIYYVDLARSHQWNGYDAYLWDKMGGRWWWLMKPVLDVIAIKPRCISHVGPGLYI